MRTSARAQRARKIRQPARAPTHDRALPAVCAAAALLVALTVIAYIPAMRAGFIWDDDQYVQNNDAVRAPGGLPRIWFDFTASPQYYPLVYSSYWLEYRLWGDNPAGYHVVNIFLHGAVAILVWRFLRRLGLPAAWVAAAIFAVHPINAESVAWITERKNVLSGIFYFAAALAYLRFAESARQPAADRRRWAWWAAALVLFAAALLSKTVTCTLPAVLLLVLWWKRGRMTFKDALPLVPFFALGIASGLFTSWFEKHYTGALGEQWSMTFLERFLVAGRVLWFYVGKLLWPANLTFIYPRWIINTHAWWQYLFPLAALAAPVVLFLARRRIGWGPLVAGLCFAGTLFPVLGFFNVYYMQYSFVADHWVYLASVALIVLVCAAVQRLASRAPAGVKPAFSVVPAVLIVALGALTWKQSRVYSDLEGLWRDVLQKNPTAWMAHNNLGNLLKDAGRLEEARSEYDAAIAVRPDFAMAHSNLGIVCKRQGRLDDAIREYRRAIQSDPDYVAAHFNLGLAFQQRGDLDQAAAEFRKYIAARPKRAEARVNLGCILMSQGQLAQAAESFEAALAINPKLIDAHLNLARIRGDQGRLAEAVAHCSRALELNPRDADARTLLDQLVALQGGRRP
jgi:tetratricopeptide (TPR) repeat protein